MTREGTMKRFDTILHPTDFSPGSDAAFGYACDLARDYNAWLVVLYTLEPALPMVGEGGPIATDLLELWDTTREQLDAVQPIVSGVRLRKVFRAGPAPATIVETANEVKADLIVMGTHGRTGIGRLFLGSVAEEVLRRAPCPVLTVKAYKPSERPQSAVAARA
jgi:universal stress protein A